MPNERTLWVGRPAMFRSHPVGFLLALLLTPRGIGLLILLMWWLKSLQTTLTVTTHRTVLRHGFLSKSTSEVRHADVRNIQLQQTFLQRLFGTGTIGISSSGQAGIEIAVSGVANPDEVVSLLRSLQERQDVGQAFAPASALSPAIQTQALPGPRQADAALQPAIAARGGTPQTGSGVKVAGILGMSFLLLFGGCCLFSMVARLFTSPKNQARTGPDVANRDPTDDQHDSGAVGASVENAEPVASAPAATAPVESPATQAESPAPNAQAVQPIASPEIRRDARSEPGLSQTTPPVTSVDDPSSRYRIWTDNTGKFTVEAEFLGLVASKVMLRRKDNGQDVTLPVDQLCKSDQKWIWSNATRRREQAEREAIMRAMQSEAANQPAAQPSNEDDFERKKQKFIESVLENTAVTDIAINGKTTMFVTLSPDKYTNRDNVRVIAETLARSYAKTIASTRVTCRVYLGNEVYAEGAYSE